MALWGMAKVQSSNVASLSSRVLGTAALAAGEEDVSTPALRAEGNGTPGAPTPTHWKQAAWAPLIGVAVGAQGAASSCSTGSDGKRGRPSCWYYEQGMCTKGIACPFKHEGGIEAAQANVFAAARIEAITPSCWFYERGCCQKASACPFKHDGLKPQGGLVFKKLKMVEHEPVEDDTIWTAVKVALEPVSHCEQEEEMRKLRTKISQYARSAVQGIDLDRRPVSVPINEYADNLFAKIFQVLGDKPWLPQADMLLVLDASVKELLPMDALVELSQDELEGIIFSAHDRAVDEQRSMPLIWDTISQMLQGPKTKSKVYKAFEAGRKDTISDPEVNAEGSAELFTRRWIASSIDHLRASAGGYVDSIMPPQTATLLFCTLVEGGALPIRCIAELSVPDAGWEHFVATAVRAAYAAPHGRRLQCEE